MIYPEFEKMGDKKGESISTDSTSHLIDRYNARKAWFIARIGKRIFRGPVHCTCETCIASHLDGIVIADEFHAIYLNDIESELGIRYLDVRLPI